MVWTTWTFRRLLHAYAVLMADRTMALQIVAEWAMGSGLLQPADGTQRDTPASPPPLPTPGAPAGAAGRPEKRGLPAWFKDHRRRRGYSVVHVEDPITMFRAAGIDVDDKPVDPKLWGTPHMSPPGAKGIGVQKARIVY